MLSGLAQAGAKALGGARFSLVNVLPATVLVGFVIALVTSGAYDPGRAPELGKPIAYLADHPGVAVFAVFGVFVFSVLLRPFQVGLVQLLEGYWQRFQTLDALTSLATERHRRKRHTAEVICAATDQADGPPNGTALGEVVHWQRADRWRARVNTRSALSVDRYPRHPDDGAYGSDDRLLPTLLGNVLRDGEDNAGYRYGLRLQVVGPRLYPCLSPTVRKAIDQNLDLLDAAAAMCVSMACATVLALPLLIRWDRWSAVPLVTAALVAVAYRGAVRVGTLHKSLLATAVDLHRFDMLTALHHSLPATPKDEWDLNTALSSFLDGKNTTLATPLRDRTYQHPATTAPKPQPELSESESD